MKQIPAHTNIRLVKIRLAKRRHSVCEANYVLLELNVLVNVILA